MSRPLPDKPPRRIVILAVTFVVAVTLGCLELLVRILAPQVTYSAASRRMVVNGTVDFDIPYYDTSDVLPYVLRPRFRADVIDRFYSEHYFIELNDRGFRTHAFSPKASNEFRVIVIGDSTTFGVGVNDNATYSRILESQLRAKTRRPVQVFNLGVGGYGPAEYYVVANKYVRELQPDIMICAFFPGNDEEDLLDARIERDERGLPRRVTRASVYVDQGHRLRSRGLHSGIYRVPVLRQSHFALFCVAMTTRITHALRRRFGEPAQPAVSLPRLAQGIADTTTGNGAGIVWLIVPQRDEVDSRHDLPFTEALANIRQTTVVNLSDGFGHGSQKRLLYVDGSHLNCRGASITAQKLVERIVTLPQWTESHK